MERGLTGWSNTSTQWPFTLAEVERAMDSESTVSF
jgi:hypothetical protein